MRKAAAVTAECSELRALVKRQQKELDHAARERAAMLAEVEVRRGYTKQLAKEKAALEVELARARSEIERMKPKHEALERWSSSFLAGRLRCNSSQCESRDLTPSSSHTRLPSSDSRAQSLEESDLATLDRLRSGSGSISRESNADLKSDVLGTAGEVAAFPEPNAREADEGIILLAELREQVALLHPEIQTDADPCSESKSVLSAKEYGNPICDDLPDGADSLDERGNLRKLAVDPSFSRAKPTAPADRAGGTPLVDTLSRTGRCADEGRRASERRTAAAAF